MSADAPGAEGGARPSVTVIVPTRDRPEALVGCVESILACDYPDFELIVVDQSDFSVPLPCTDPRLTCVRSDTVGKTRALNEALTHARGDLVAFTDDDCTVPPGWLARAADLMEEGPDLGLIFGAFVAAPHDHESVFIPYFRPEGALRLVGPKSYRRVGGVSGGNLVARKAALEHIGGFDEVQGPGAPFRSAEEYDLLYRGLRAGYTVLLDPDNHVLHWGARSYADGSVARLLRGYRVGRGAVTAKHLRCGDIHLVRDILEVTARELLAAGRGLVTRGRPTGLGRLTHFWRGMLAGWRQPLDRERRLYRASTR